MKFSNESKILDIFKKGRKKWKIYALSTPLTSFNFSRINVYKSRRLGETAVTASYSVKKCKFNFACNIEIKLAFNEKYRYLRSLLIEVDDCGMIACSVGTTRDYDIVMNNCRIANREGVLLINGLNINIGV